MKLGFSYKFLFYLLLIVVLAYIALKYFNLIEGLNRGDARKQAKMQAQYVKDMYPDSDHPPHIPLSNLYNLERKLDERTN